MQGLILSSVGGSLLIVASIIQIISRRNILKKGTHTTAVVTETIPHIFLNTFQVIKFEANESIHEVKYHRYLNPKYKEGEVVEIAHDKNNAKNVIIIGDSIVRMSNVFLTLGGLLIILGGIIRWQLLGI